MLKIIKRFKLRKEFKETLPMIQKSLLDGISKKLFYECLDVPLYEFYESEPSIVKSITDSVPFSHGEDNDTHHNNLFYGVISKHLTYYDDLNLSLEDKYQIKNTMFTLSHGYIGNNTHERFKLVMGSELRVHLKDIARFIEEELLHIHFGTKMKNDKVMVTMTHDEDSGKIKLILKITR